MRAALLLGGQLGVEQGLSLLWVLFEQGWSNSCSPLNKVPEACTSLKQGLHRGVEKILSCSEGLKEAG